MELNGIVLQEILGEEVIYLYSIGSSTFCVSKENI